MKRYLIVIVVVIMFLAGCASESAQYVEIADPQTAILRLQEGNERYREASYNDGDISEAVRVENAREGQEPYAVIVTCSDSRVPPEHIFMSGIGELFVVRTAGNVIGKFELGSIEYGVEHLQAKAVVVLGHTGCGAVDAAIKGEGTGYIQTIISEIKANIKGERDAATCEVLNVEQGVQKILSSEIVKHLVDEGEVQVVGGLYDTETGEVKFFQPN